jgi:hypothetical protein
MCSESFYMLKLLSQEKLYPLADLGLPLDASDREVWEVCQRVQVVLVTTKRNDEPPASSTCLNTAYN